MRRIEFTSAFDLNGKRVRVEQSKPVMREELGQGEHGTVRVSCDAFGAPVLSVILDRPDDRLDEWDNALVYTEEDVYEWWDTQDAAGRPIFPKPEILTIGDLWNALVRFGYLLPDPPDDPTQIDRDKLAADAADDAIHNACLTIQKALKIEFGDTASAFFSGNALDPLKQQLREYIDTELAS